MSAKNAILIERSGRRRHQIKCKRQASLKAATEKFVPSSISRYQLFDRIFNVILSTPYHPNKKERCVSSVRYQFLRNHLTDFDKTLHALYTLPKDDVRPNLL